ncbi:hypothetical protein, partial [Salmonella enterica]|uniref:hypothetical protein n=1 Tax=Salmonella enterica TaxID=28901 RepID=UPI003CE79FB0
HKIILEKDVLNNYNSLSGPLEAWEELLTGTRNLLKIASHSKNTAVWFSVLKSPNNRNNWAYPYVDRKNLKRSFYDSR